MTKQAILEIIKIKKSVTIESYSDNQKSSLIILERNYFDKNLKNYIFRRISEYLRLKKETGSIIPFSELIFLELLNPSQHFSNFNLLLQQTMELFVSFICLIKMNNVIRKFFKISNWNLVNPEILLKFRSIFNNFEEAKGFRNTKESQEKKTSRENYENKEFITNKLEKIRILLDNGNFLISGILINNLFRINQWNLLKYIEKKILSEQIIRILKKTKNFFLLSKFYFINSDCILWNTKNLDYSKLCIFLSSFYFRISIRSNLVPNLEKLLKIKVANLFTINVSNFLVDKSTPTYRSVNRLKILSEIFENFFFFLKKNGLNKMRRSLKRKLIEEHLISMATLYETILITKIKKKLKTDSKDIEYHLLFNFENKKNFFGIDNYRGILYFNFI
jgi:hypothetical protein|eukprot:Tamp_14998.p1 GENE.Tamp_14998~~Tamp_14998.p1  ORF type:complete len:391 (-),score=36.54 Tamp_14998:96-1268(-)